MQTMELNIPSLKSDILFEVMVNNAIQQKSFEEIKPKLIRFLADELHNDFLEMKIRIDETQELNKVELPRDIFEDLMQHNPTFQKLVSELKLTLED